METSYWGVIIATFIGFTLLAFLLLWPVHKFLKREEEAGEKWTDRHRPKPPTTRQPPSANGSSGNGSSGKEG